MTAVLTNLESQLFLTGNAVCIEGEKMKDLIIIAKGSLKMYGFYDHRGESHKMLIASLPKKSWYGDFQIFFDRDSPFRLEAGKVKRNDAK